MFIDYLESILHFIAILAALLMSLFGYISSKNRVWLCAVGSFTGCLLSSYFWTAYLVIMGEQPVASDLLIYFGWNLSYFMLVFLMHYSKSREERRYFHPLMFVPIPLNIWQLILYMEYGGILNSIYEVTVCTVVACMAIQSIMWYFKKRREGAKPPYIALAILICITAEFGMWTSTCFDGWIYDLYYIFSILCSLSYLFLIWSIRKTYLSDIAGKEVKIDKRIQNILKVSYFAAALICSAGGILLGHWIRDVLVASAPENPTEGATEIITVVMFLISIVLVAFTIFIIFIVYFEQKVAENSTLKEARRVADQSNAAKSSFLANMSHEIRTPINAVLGMNRMIMNESVKGRNAQLSDSNEVRRVFSDITGYSANIDSAGNNLLSIINDILDFSKIEAGKLTITARNYKLSSVLNDVSNMVMIKAEEKKLNFRIEADSGLPDGLCGDETRIRQVMVNILNNAVKYTDKGSVTLLVSSAEKREYKTGDELELIIAAKDTGIGIKKEDIGKIFDKFERMDMVHNSTVEGTGLGLSITYHLVEMMGGSIGVESEYGSGSTFTIRLPQKIVSTEPVGEFRDKIGKRVEDLSGGEICFTAPDAHILIVDDTKMNLFVAVGLLKDTLIKTDTAESGAEALELARRKRYDIVLLDQRMPVMDGTQTLHRLREQKGFAHTPIICLTADAISGARERYVSEGFNDYLSKPIDCAALKRTIMKYLPKDKVKLSSGEAPVQEKKAVSKSDDNFFDTLREAGIDTAQGLMYCQNSEELYRTLLVEYVKSSKERTVKLRDCFDKADWKGYTTLVHSLKSTSGTIGAAELSGIAAGLEKAAIAGSFGFITAGHDSMLEKYAALTEKIAEAVGAENTDDAGGASVSDDDVILEFLPE